MNLVCAVTILIGFTNPLSTVDRQSLKAATKRCSEIYPEAPCLKKFIKKEERVFWAICGEAPKQTSWSDYHETSTEWALLHSHGPIRLTFKFSTND